MEDLKRIYSIPLNNRVKFCHPDNIALAIGNSVKNFINVDSKTLIISGGSSQRILYKDMMGGILSILGMPLPPERKFTKEPYSLDWYDTSESESQLHFQSYTFADYLNDSIKQLSQYYGKLFAPFMRRFIGPIFGRVISRLM